MDSIVSTILGTIDGIILSTGETLFNSTVALMGTFYTVALTLFLVLIGINMVLGIWKVSMKESVQIMVRLVLIIMFGLSWSNFEPIYVALTDGTQALALSFFTPFAADAGETTATDAIDRFGGQMAQTTDTVAEAISSYFRSLIAFFLNVILALLLAAYVIVVAASKIVIAFLLGVAPFAILCTLFDKTKNLFEGWLTTLVANLMYPVVAAGIVGTIVAAANTIFTAGDETSTLGDFMAFIVLMLAGAMAILRIPQVAQGLTGSFGIAGFSPRPLVVAGSALGKAVGMTYAGRKAGNRYDQMKERMSSGQRRADFEDYGGMTRDESKRDASVGRMKEAQANRMRMASQQGRMRDQWRKSSKDS